MQQKLLVIPSIDIKNGKCVRTVQGIPELDCYEYGNNPVEMAKIWRAENAKMIHVKDFDGAHEQSKRNIKVIEEICSSVLVHAMVVRLPAASLRASCPTRCQENFGTSESFPCRRRSAPGSAR